MHRHVSADAGGGEVSASVPAPIVAGTLHASRGQPYKTVFIVSTGKVSTVLLLDMGWDTLLVADTITGF